MINEKQIKELVGTEKLIKYSKELCSNYNLSEEIRKILQEIGIPKSVAPYISFFDEEKGGGKKLSDYYDLSLYEESEFIKKEELDEIKIYFQKYIVLGNIENDIFVLNEKYRIIRIDYETLDEYYVNYTLDAFLESILAYKRTIDRVQNRYEEMVYFDDNVTKDDIQFLKKKLLEIDGHSIDEESFWSCEIEALEENITP